MAILLEGFLRAALSNLRMSLEQIFSWQEVASDGSEPSRRSSLKATGGMHAVLFASRFGPDAEAPRQIIATCGD